MPPDKSEIARLVRQGSARLSFRKKNEGKSKVWAKFDLVACDEVVVPFVVCRDCRTVYTYSHKDGTSSLVAHKCGMKSAGAGQGSISNFCRPDVSDAAYSAAKRKVTEAAVACIVKDLRPFRFIVGEGIGELAQALINIGADNKRRVDAAKCLPSDVTVAREVRRKAEQGRAALKERLAKEMVTCAVTTDGWVDPHRHVSYVCVTIHYIDQAGLLKAEVLSTRQMEVAHTADNVLAEVSAVLDEFVPRWKNEKRVCAFVTDNAANQKRAFRDDREFWTWFGCACHNINLVVKNGIDMKTLGQDPDLRRLAVQIAATKSLVSLVRRKGLDYHLTQSLKQECETRWNSLLAMVRSVVDSLEQMRSHAAFQSQDVVELIDALNPTLLRRLVSVLSPLETATEKLSGEQYPTLHLVVPTKERLQRALALESGDDGVTRALKKRLSRLVDEKFTIKDQHLVATMLWPPFRRLEQFRGTVSAEDREQAVEDLVTAATELNGEMGREGDSSDENDEPASMATTSAEAEATGSTEDFFCFSEAQEASHSSPDTDRSAKAEVERYLIDPGSHDASDVTSILRYWTSAGTRAQFPILCRLARRLLAVPASSTPSERTFSVAGRVIEERRTSLLPSTVDDIIFLHGLMK